MVPEECEVVDRFWSYIDECLLTHKTAEIKECSIHLRDTLKKRLDQFHDRQIEQRKQEYASRESD